MTTNEALGVFYQAVTMRSFLNEDENILEAHEALSVLRAVVEDYEKARPLLDEVVGAENIYALHDGPILKAALAYREGRKP